MAAYALLRARSLEKALGTPAHIYYKYEGTSPSGSHKLNTALPQAFYNKAEGVSGLTTETGAGQWGTALSIATNFFGLTCEVYMVKISYQQKPYRRAIMQTFGANVYASPSDRTNAGRSILAKNPDSMVHWVLRLAKGLRRRPPAAANINIRLARYSTMF